MIHNPLTPHPRTVLWMEQRKQCDNCEFQIPADARNSSRGSSGVRCRLYPIKTTRRPDEFAYCIDARDEHQPCGPDAVHFKPKAKP